MSTALQKRVKRKDDKPSGVTAGGLDPYALLGVHRDATDEQIKAAFRSKAKECHPDLGGDKEEFEQLKLCYDTLLDPERRAEFDRTGEVRKRDPDTVMADAYNRISLVFGMVLAELKAKNAIPEQCDLIRLMRLKFEEEDRKRLTQKAELNEHIPLWESFCGRFSAKKGRNYLADLVQGTIAQMKQSLLDIERWGKADKMARTIIEDYEFKFDRPAPKMMPGFTMVNLQNGGFNTGTQW